MQQPVCFVLNAITELLVSSFKTASELINTSAGINEFLLTGKERMTLGADVNADFVALCGTSSECLAASANNFCFNIVGMDCFFHYTNST